jgi:hypothetical protein
MRPRSALEVKGFSKIYFHPHPLVSTPRFGLPGTAERRRAVGHVQLPPQPTGILAARRVTGDPEPT